MKIRVTSTALNAGALVRRCIQSVANQTHTDWTMDFFDADSADATWPNARVGSFAMPDNVRLHKNESGKRKDILENLLPLWRSFDPDDIVVWLDGDDELATRQALATVFDHHKAGAWITYGQFIWEDGSMGFAGQCGENPRAEPWRATHLKTFRAGLTRKLKDWELKGLRYAGDQAVMLAMLEMASKERSHFIPNVLYVFNSHHSLVANSKDRTVEFAEVGKIRAYSRYPQVSQL